MKNFKFPALILFCLFGFAAAATADAGECKPTDKAVNTAVTAKTGFPVMDYNIVIGDFQYDAGNKTCSGWVMLDHQHKPRPLQVGGLQVTAPK